MTFCHVATIRDADGDDLTIEADEAGVYVTVTADCEGEDRCAHQVALITDGTLARLEQAVAEALDTTRKARQ